MITLSLNFDNALNGKSRSTHEKQIRDIVDTHLGFPGSDKLKMGVTIKDNGFAAVSFTGPKDAIAEATRLWKENVKPVAAKAKRAVTRATKTVKKAAKSAKTKVKATATKRTPAKATKRTVKKRKS